MRLGASDVPTDGWLPTEASATGTNVRRRLHWRFRQRLSTLGGFKEKLETANWSMTRTVQKVTDSLRPAPSQPMQKTWNALDQNGPNHLGLWLIHQVTDSLDRLTADDLSLDKPSNWTARCVCATKETRCWYVKQG